MQDVRVGIEEEAGVEVRVQGLVLNGREGKVRNVELLNIQNAMLGKGGRRRTSVQESGSNTAGEKPERNSEFRIWKHFRKCYIRTVSNTN